MEEPFETAGEQGTAIWHASSIRGLAVRTMTPTIIVQAAANLDRGIDRYAPLECRPSFAAQRSFFEDQVER